MTQQELADLFIGTSLEMKILEMTSREFEFLMVHYDPENDILIDLDSSGFTIKCPYISSDEIRYNFY